MKSIDINDIKNLGEIELIDVREKFEYSSKKIPGSTNIPMVGLLTNHDKFLTKDKKYYIMCLSGGRSKQVVEKLEALGYDVVNLKGGINKYSF